MSVVAAGVLGPLERVLRRHPDRRVEQDAPAIRSGPARRELEHEPSAEAVADPESRVRRHRLEQVVEVLLDRPGRLGAGASVAAQVGRDDVELLREALPRESREPLAVGGDAVRRRRASADRDRPMRGGAAARGESTGELTPSRTGASCVSRSLQPAACTPTQGGDLPASLAVDATRGERTHPSRARESSATILVHTRAAVRSARRLRLPAGPASPTSSAASLEPSGR